ncbi:hypothetical protein [Streptococcus dentiloxodontae]
MTTKERLKENFSKAKTAVTRNWKKTLLFSAALLAVGGAGIAVGAHFAHEGYDHMDMAYSMETEADDLTYEQDDDFSYEKETAMTYDEWKKTVNDSSLSSADKKTFLEALDKSKDQIEKVNDLQTQIDKLYTDNLEGLDTEFTNLIAARRTIWNKLDSDITNGSLSDINTDGITDLKQEIKTSSLTDDEKAKLLSDLESLKTLKENYSAAYATYTEKASDLYNQFETAQNALTTSFKDNKVTDDMLAEVMGYSDSYDGKSSDNHTSNDELNQTDQEQDSD